ncbi:hypothetical protein P3T21_007767 [Paraburkholderia sp. GAS334]
MGFANTGKPRAVGQTAGQAGGYVWMIPLLNLTPCELMRSIVSGENFATESAAKDSGDAREKATAEEKLVHH